MKKDVNYSFLYSKMVGHFIKKGKKSLAKKVVDSSFASAALTHNHTPYFIVYKIFSLLNNYIEVKYIKSRKKVFAIPFPISLKRRQFLILKSIVKSIVLKNRKSAFYNLSNQLSGILNGSSELFNLKKLNNISAIKNRSHIHFRW
jgi:small subunit ribosomal protein S7